jgi:hypothetical protein
MFLRVSKMLYIGPREMKVGEINLVLKIYIFVH